MNQNYNLPPGTTSRHISPKKETCDACNGSGIMQLSNCCGARILDIDLCARCKEHCDTTDCDECNGTGVVNA